ncbi:hypothetical protein M422DRAFT_240986 [Sphaerobolus stellatus SS14]|nr:hypothetical protein M422DRAFT_240986 [Sphaerobolus stellatus SS14]
MPPRPRPRPKPRVVAAPEPSSSEGNPSSPKPKAGNVEDDLFIRNRGRSLREINKRAAEVEVVKRAASVNRDSDDETGSEEEETPKANRNGTKLFEKGKQHAPPKWAKKGGIQNLLKTMEDDEDRDDDSNSGTPTKRRRGRESTNDTPTKRARSRSKSLTPPPELTDAEKLRTKLAIQQVLRNEQNDMQSAPQVAVVDIEDDDEDGNADEQLLDPALQSIAMKVRERHDKGLDDADLHHSSDAITTVAVAVNWIWHPNEAAEGRTHRSWAFELPGNQSFKPLVQKVASKANVPLTDVVLMREGRRIYTSITPSSLGVGDEVELDACTQSTYEVLRSNFFRSPTPALRHGADSDREGSAAPSEGSNAEEDSDKFKLVLRAAGTKDITLSVRPTTTCAKIVRAFLAVLARQGGPKLTAAKAKKVRLCVDGEKQDPESPISDGDLEDGDMVEVVGL